MVGVPLHIGGEHLLDRDLEEPRVGHQYPDRVGLSAGLRVALPMVRGEPEVQRQLAGRLRLLLHLLLPRVRRAAHPGHPRHARVAIRGLAQPHSVRVHHILRHLQTALRMVDVLGLVQKRT